MPFDGQKFIRFLNTIEAEIPAGKIVHVILDNYGSHKHPKVRARLARHLARLAAEAIRRSRRQYRQFARTRRG